MVRRAKRLYLKAGSPVVCLEKLSLEEGGGVAELTAELTADNAGCFMPTASSSQSGSSPRLMGLHSPGRMTGHQPRLIIHRSNTTVDRIPMFISGVRSRTLSTDLAIWQQ